MAPATGTVGGSRLKDKLADPAQVKKYAKYLHAHIRLREAVQINKRVNYFRGAKLFDALLDPSADAKKDKNRPVCANEDEAKLVGVALLQHGLIHASEVANRQRRELRPVRSQDFEAKGYYTWIYEGSKTMRNLMLGSLVLAIASMCLFPIWPQQLKVGIWYISVTFVLFFLILFSVRLMVYLCLWSVGFEFWIFPNFFDEDLGVMDSLTPIISFARGQDLKKSWIFRAAGLVGIVAFGFWCFQQPTDFDELYASQMEFLNELYNGKLLVDPAIEESIRINAIPDVHELEKEIEREEQGLDPNKADEDGSVENEDVDADLFGDEDGSVENEDIDANLLDDEVLSDMFPDDIGNADENEAESNSAKSTDAKE